jgi:DtxR family Mn-dependent transcriptional regulator
MNMALTWLILFVVAVIALAMLLWPNKGLAARWKSWRAAVEREQVEDALKVLLDHKWEGLATSPDALVAHLGLSAATVLRLVTRMEAQGLVQTRGSELALTAEGEQWALQVVRAHRLWERYLASEARMPLAQIHREAHHREHGLTLEQVNDLDAALGYPLRDPHGDPIPTRSGQVIGSCATPLTAWPVGQLARIVHLEDEPPMAYAQILAEGLRLSQTVRILEASPERYTLTDGENEYRLAPAVAANVCVEPLPEAQAMPTGTVPLVNLKDRSPAEIVSLDEACHGFTRRRFLDLGLTPGTTIYPELTNAFGDPRAYRVRSTLIALRKDQAAQIWVKPIN